MMPGLIELLFAYGIAFGLMNKLPMFVYEKLPQFFNRLLSCAYCTGFHAGWIAYLLLWGAHPHWVAFLGWALASAAFSYIIDGVGRWLEGHTPLGG